MKTFFLFILISALNIFSLISQEVVSPDKNIKVVIKVKKTSDNGSSGQLYFSVLYRKGPEYVEVLPGSQLGISRADQQFVDNLDFVGESAAVEVHDKYEMLCGKRKVCENFGTEKIFSYKNSENRPVNIIFWVYNDGVAFRYVFPDSLSSSFNIISEATAYSIPDSTMRWMQPYDVSYEDFYPLARTGTGNKKGNEWAYPALYKVNNCPLWVLISEADITENNCASKLCNLQNKNEYVVTYPSPRNDFKQTGAMASLPWGSPWHTLIIGKLSDIVESTLITDVSSACQLKDTEWIKPGPVAWIYWANNHGSKDYQKVVEYVDLAVEMGWPYVLIDWEWDVMGNGGDIKDAVNYAKSKGIKPLMWYNSGTAWLGPTPVDRLLTPQKRAEEFTWLNEIGVYGIKVDFFAGDQQDMMKYYIDILKDAARFHLLVNFHGATVPRGWARTYPNLMTSEGVYGAEWYNNNSILTEKAARHNATLPFTRNVIGSMDYTPVTFSNTQHPHITSYGHELALAVIFESGLQHFADSPDAYNNLLAGPKEFLKHVPVSWDDTKLIDGFPGEKVIMARRKGNQWYVGGINGKDEPVTLYLKFDFLDKGSYHFMLIQDGNDNKTFKTKGQTVRKGDVVMVDCLPRGGFVGIIDKRKK